MNKITALFKLLRFELPFSAGVCVVMGQLLALGRFASVSEMLLGFSSVFLISASILVLNDYFDIETDKINAPHRPLPSNTVTQAEALSLAVTLMFGGLFLSFLLGIVTLLSAVALLIIGFLYNRLFKQSGLPGNLMVSLSVGMTFIYGAMAVGQPLNKRAWFFGVIAALIDLGEEIAADAMDMQGDQLIASNSLAIKYGKAAALRISSLIFYFVILLTGFPFILGWFRTIYIAPITVMDVSIAYGTFKLLKCHNESGRKYIRWIYLGATLGLLIFIFMRLIGI